MSEQTARSMTPADILRSALRKEEAAYRFYASMLEMTRVDEVRALLARLRDEEAKHVQLVKRQIVALNLG